MCHNKKNNKWIEVQHGIKSWLFEHRKLCTNLPSKQHGRFLLAMWTPRLSSWCYRLQLSRALYPSEVSTRYRLEIVHSDLIYMKRATIVSRLIYPINNTQLRAGQTRTSEMKQMPRMGKHPLLTGHTWWETSMIIFIG